ncbi:MAG: N-glycosylase/DNA lyase [Candidatus Bathyarchaeia archaeon]|nr:N-glycosylase/DNA lyase [Candidatus Bathyarchaeota archaeon]
MGVDGDLEGLTSLIERVENLKRSAVKSIIDARVKEFMESRNKPPAEIFKELCFCILTANFSAEKSIKIQSEIGDGFLNLSESMLAEKLRSLNHRYPEIRAKYIVEARKIINPLWKILNSSLDGKFIREWLVKNVKGIGYKEASHFLRNIGFMNLAIIDFHIINVLSKYGLIKRPKTLTRCRYLEIEGLLSEIADKIGLSLGELDLYLWYMETGKVLK